MRWFVQLEFDTDLRGGSHLYLYSIIHKSGESGVRVILTRCASIAGMVWRVVGSRNSILVHEKLN